MHHRGNAREECDVGGIAPPATTTHKPGAIVLVPPQVQRKPQRVVRALLPRARSAPPPSCLAPEVRLTLPTSACDKVRNLQAQKWCSNFFRHHSDMIKSFVPTSVLGMARMYDFLKKSCFFTKLMILNPGLGYFRYNSNMT